MPERAKELTHGGGADAAFDLFGGDGHEQAFGALRQGGRLVSIASPPAKREHCETGYIFVRPPVTTSASTSRRWWRVGGWCPHIAATFPLEETRRRHERLEAGHVRGKLVLTID